MKKLISIIILCLLLCGCRPIDGGTGKDTTINIPPINIEVETIVHETEPEADRTTDGRTVVCIDAGHGFDDVGCGPSYMGCYEYEVTIAAAKQLKASLEKLGAEVILTHDGESYPSETDIIAKCKKLGIEYKEDGIIENNIFSAYERGIYEEILIIEENIDFFISLHVNSVENADYVDGYELYYCEDNPYSYDLQAFGNRLDEVLDNDIVVDGTEYDDSYIVTKYADIPSVLLEIGYATNPEDARKMTSESWRSQFADILAAEIVNYIEK